jgi:serine/threonine protein kinase
MESSRSASNTPVPANVASPSPSDRSRAVDSDTVPLSEASMGEDKRVLREVSILALLYHPYIVQLVDFVITTHYYYLVFEYVEGGQMLDYIISHGKLSERVARKFIRQIVSSLDYCHKNSIVHRGKHLLHDAIIT